MLNLNIPKKKRRKFYPKSQKVIFVGYDGESSNYRLWDKTTRKIYISSDVDVHEENKKCKELNKENARAQSKIRFGIENYENNEAVPEVEAVNQVPEEEEALLCFRK